jgi:hypothetical protein
MRWLSFWKALIPPAIVPLALWMAVALAGPGGIVEVGNEPEPTPAAADVDGGSDGVDGGGEGVDGGTDESDGFVTDDGNGNGCEQALVDEAQARTQLEGHATDGDKPSGGADGNENALDKQCGGALDESLQEATAPSADQADTGPGKSEQSSGNTGGGNANGEGQANADDSGNGAADAPGQNEP